MLENSNFYNGIKFNNNSNNKENIKNSKIYSVELNNTIKRMKKKHPTNKIFKFLFFCFFICLLFCFLKLKSPKQNNNEKISYIYDKPILPFNKEDIIVKPFNKIYYNSSNLRYHFHDLFKNRKIFKINYSYLPYTKINREISFDENAKNIYELTGILNLTKLYIYYNNKDIDTSKFNHIHLGMSFDTTYIFLTTISIASILNTSSSDTYIHFHLEQVKWDDL